MFQLEDAELASSRCPTAGTRGADVVLSSAAEGGAGVLRRLVEEPGALADVAREALGICHFDPDTGEDLAQAPGAREDCDAACYDCLMCYTNQPDHALLDRQSIQPLLQQLAGVATRTAGGSA